MDKDPEVQARALKAWEKRRLEGKAKMSEEARQAISAGVKDKQIGTRMLIDRMKRLEAVLRGYGFSEEELRNM